MMSKIRLLYIVYFDFENSSGSASRVRPKKLFDAFIEEGVEVKLLSGDHRKFKERKRSIKETLDWLETNDVDLCYIELPSGPLFHYDDLKLIRSLHKKGIKISIFYRDLYWMFPDMFHSQHGVIGNLKGKIIATMQKRDLKLFKNTVDIIYIPSETMGSHLNLEHYKVLPPGCDKPGEIVKPILNNSLTAIYVGGASERYGTHLLLDSFKSVNEKYPVELILVCPKAQWDSLPDRYKALEDERWLTLKHLTSNELAEYYARADFGVIPLKKNIYNDFAVPVKLFEYISYHKPVLTTDCTESKKFVEHYGIGLVVEDTIEDMRRGIETFYEQYPNLERYQLNVKKAVLENLWKKRSRKIITDITGEEK